MICEWSRYSTENNNSCEKFTFSLSLKWLWDAHKSRTHRHTPLIAIVHYFIVFGIGNPYPLSQWLPLSNNRKLSISRLLSNRVIEYCNSNSCCKRQSLHTDKEKPARTKSSFQHLICDGRPNTRHFIAMFQRDMYIQTLHWLMLVQPWYQWWCLETSRQDGSIPSHHFV